MKKISKYLLILAAAVFTFTACEKNVEREPSPEDSPLAVSFTSGGEVLKLNLAKDPLETTVALHRTRNLDKADTVKVTVVEADPVFVIDPVFIFAPGDKEVAHKVTFAAGQADSTYTFKLAVPENKVSPYLSGLNTFEYTVTLELWSAPAMGVFVEQTVGPAFGLGVNAWFVEYQTAENPDGSMRFRMINPYASFKSGDPDADGIFDGNPWTEDGDVDESQDYNFVLNVSAEGEVTFPDLFTYLGIGWGDYSHQFFVDYAAGTGAAGTYGRFDKEAGKITFDAQDNSILWGVYTAAGERKIYGVQANFVFYLSKAAYLADQEEGGEAVDADVNTYVGNWKLQGRDLNTGGAAEAEVVIATNEDADGQYYTIEGIHPDVPVVYGVFNEEDHRLNIYPSRGTPVEKGGVTYKTTFYALNSGYSILGSITIDFEPAEDGTLVLSEATEGVGFAVLYENPDDEEDYDITMAWDQLGFVPSEAAGVPAKVAKRNGKQTISAPKVTVAHPKKTMLKNVKVVR